MPQSLIINPLRYSDSYKDGHIWQYPPNTTDVYEYYEARGGEYPYQVLFGLQYILKSKLAGEFFTQQNLNDEAEDSQIHFGAGYPYPKDAWQYILDKHQGRLPLEIRAVKEGIAIPIHNVMLTIRATDPNCFWLPGWVESVIQQVWYPSTVATKSRTVKELFKEFYERTTDNSSYLFALHDFALRGVSSMESAALGGAAHLINFLGTDTKAAMDLLHQFYNAPRVSGFSVAASEHSTMTTWGREGEMNAVGNLLDKFPTGIVSIVGDSYDIYNFTRTILGGTYRDRIRARSGKVVVRPDSGDPNEVVPRVLRILAEQFGVRENSRGYKVLPPCVGVIQGDGMDYYSIRSLLSKLESLHWSAENVVVGMGVDYYRNLIATLRRLRSNVLSPE
jgi:nicotinamide phosphoribosyltransferase